MSTAMSMLPENASAQLVMLQGSLCSVAELTMFLDQFDYKEDPSRISHWVFVSDNPDDAVGCSLKIDADGETLTVYGDSSEHFSRINFLIQKAGWKECSVVSANPDIEAKLLARLVSVGVNSSVTDNLPASSLSSVAPNQIRARQSVSSHQSLDEEQHLSDVAEAYPSTTMLDEEHERIETLTIRGNALEEKIAALESENARLLADNTNLRTAHRAPSASHQQLDISAQVDAHALLRAIENHMTESLDLSGLRGTQLVRDLEALGFTFQVRLAQSATR